MMDESQQKPGKYQRQIPEIQYQQLLVTHENVLKQKYEREQSKMEVNEQEFV